jgi:hypothetical protein
MDALLRARLKVMNACRDERHGLDDVAMTAGELSLTSP